MRIDQRKIDKTLENSTDQRKSQKIYVSMAHMSTNAESIRRNYGYRSQPTNWILDSDATFCMTPEI